MWSPKLSRIKCKHQAFTAWICKVKHEMRSDFPCCETHSGSNQNLVYWMTSRRTSRPCIGKQSDPTDKGKGKEKRPAEEEVESGFDLELEEAFRKAKEDEEKRDELHRKRSKDALRFNTIPRMKEGFFDGTHNRNFNVLNITKIQDEMNPKLKKRKREPVVAYVFETDLGIYSQMVQVANMTARNNTMLTSLIEHIPNMIKRVIDKALAPVHVKIQDLEHRIYELEVIGAREALAMLKAEMSKVKTDVKQLQLDLSIFDASLLEDECSMDDVTAQMVDVGLSFQALAGEESDTAETTTLAQFEEAKDV
ncbi:hypothetical protein HAX54_031869 [Datura stramonium]|uniref:Uncharacterized protein n=1 Tax=Datura stramonium TaxID=4076 RepID=A0ABS8SC74_DATST|nr:hypothetical protein [Datura stramonium]